MIRSVAIVGGTHGNELNGVELAKHLQRNPALAQRPSFQTQVILANPAAIERNVRYVDEDLNRCFTRAALGDATRDSREARRAKELDATLGPKGSAAPATDLVIDLHNTTAATGVCVLTAREDELCVALAAHLVLEHNGEEEEVPVRLALWPDRPREEYALLPTVAPHGITFEVGPAPWGCVAPAQYARSLALLARALDYVHAHNESIARNAAGADDAWRVARVPAYRALTPLPYPRHANGDLAATIHPARQARDFEPLRRGDPLFMTLDTLETVEFDGAPDVDGDVFYPFFINEAAYYEVDKALVLAAREEIEVRLAPNADGGRDAKRARVK